MNEGVEMPQAMKVDSSVMSEKEINNAAYPRLSSTKAPVPVVDVSARAETDSEPPLGTQKFRPTGVWGQAAYLRTGGSNKDRPIVPQTLVRNTKKSAPLHLAPKPAETQSTRSLAPEASKGSGSYLTPPATPSSCRNSKVSATEIKTLIRAMPSLPPYEIKASLGLQHMPLPDPSNTLATSAPAILQQYSYFARVDVLKRDILITADRIIHNFGLVNKTVFSDGQELHELTDAFSDGKHDVIERLLNMTDEAQGEFWHKNWVEIHLDFSRPLEFEDGEDAYGRRLTRAKKSVITKMHEFGENTGIYKYAKTLYVTIACPEEDQFPMYRSCSKRQQRAPEFREVVDVVEELKRYTAIEKLEVIIQNKSGSRSPLTLEQLNFVLPFYDHPFEDWQLMWQNDYMTFPEPLDSWPLSYLDREMHKVHQVRQRQSEREMRGQKRLVAGAVSGLAEGVGKLSIEDGEVDDARGDTLKHHLHVKKEAPI